jgi:nitrogen fixation protein NifB
MKNPAWNKVGSKFAHMTSAHPCFNEKAHFTTARIHLPVAPKCNIQCMFCSRSKNKCEHRPGAYSHLMKPEEAVEKVQQTREEMPELKVVGIAGPGEPLFNDETFETFRLIRDAFPDMHLCVATNGLLLPDRIEELKDVGVGSITVTINGIHPEIVAQVVGHVYYDGTLMRGVEGAEVLTKHQLRGLEMAYDLEIPVKINTVLIPTINRGEITPIAREASARGAWLMNIIPLIPLYQFRDLPAPTCDELKSAREEAEQFLPKFRLCRQCRADAVGVPGKEHHEPHTGTEYFHG